MQWQPQQPVPPAPPQSRFRRWVHWIMYPVAVIVSLSIGGLADGQMQTASSPAPTVTVTATAEPAAETSTEPPSPSYATPKPADFKLTVKTRKKECFGSAGCNVTYQVDATWFQDFDPSITYDLPYEVRGGEDGSVVNTMTIEGDTGERIGDREVSEAVPNPTRSRVSCGCT